MEKCCAQHIEWFYLIMDRLVNVCLMFKGQVVGHSLVLGLVHQTLRGLQ